MKKKSLLIKNLGMGLTFLSLAACTSDECAECHVTTEINGTEYELVELGEYCEDDLHDIEEGGYTIQDTLFLDAEGDSLPSPVIPGAANEVHCGEEHDH